MPAKCSMATRNRLSMLCVGILLVVCTCLTAVNQDHILRLVLYKMCFTGAAAFSCCRPPISRAPQERAIRSRSRVRVYAAALRSGFGCALSCGTFRAKNTADFYSARTYSSTPQRRYRHCFSFYFREAASSNRLFCCKAFFPNHKLVFTLRIVFPR